MTSIKNKLMSEIENKEAVVGILGLGYVGLPLMLRFSELDFPVIGLDVDVEKISKLKDGSSYIEHIHNEKIASFISKRKNIVTSDFQAVKDCDALIICVPTPLNKYREPDLTYVIQTIETAIPFTKKGQIVSLESTTYPGTTEEELLPRLKNAGYEVGEDYFLVYSPEREDPGNANFTTETIPKIIGGVTSNCLEAGSKLYGSVIDKVVPVSSTRAAEMTKLLENIHRAINIGLVNEMKIVADRMNIDIHEVIDAAATKPFGFTPYYPGPGLGGHCIPIDPFYLTWKAREYGLHTRFIELAGEINSSMPQYVVEKTTAALNSEGKSIKGSNILILGIAYKKNVDDMRESPAVEIMELLESKGANLSYSDPHVPVFPKMRDHSFELSSITVTPENLQNFDCVLLTTNHEKFDYDLILANSKLLIDTRGVYRDKSSNVIKA